MSKYCVLHQESTFCSALKFDIVQSLVSISGSIEVTIHPVLCCASAAQEADNPAFWQTTAV